MSPLEPIPYSTGDFQKRDPLVTLVIALNFCVAVSSILFSAFFALMSLEVAIQDKHELASLLVQPPPPNTWYAVPGPPPAPHPSTAPAPFRALNATEISTAISVIQNRLEPSPHHSSLTRQQVRSLQELLSQQPQTVIDPNVPIGSEVSGRLQIVRAAVSNNGTLTLTINRGSPSNFYRTKLDSAGKQLPAPFASSMPVQTIVASQHFTTIPPPEVIQIYRDKFASGAFALAIFGTNLLLDLVLIVAAILLLISVRTGVLILWVFVVAKLVLVALQAIPLPLTVSGGSVTIDIPFGSASLVASALYPAALIFLLRRNVFRNPLSTKLSGHEPSKRADSTPRAWKVVGTFSLFYAVASLLVIGIFFWGTVSGMRNSTDDLSERDGSVAGITFALVVMALLVILLIAGAIRLLRSQPRGIFLHRLFAGLQILCSVILAVAIMSAIGNSEAGMFFYIGAFPGLVGCIYPVAVLIALRTPRVEENALLA